MTRPHLLERMDPGAVKKAFENDENVLIEWLSDSEALAALGDEIGTRLRLVGANRQVGPSQRADVIAESSDYGRVVIESQLGTTDWDHFGRLLGYASALGAGCLVWLAADVLEPHAKAANWLNSLDAEGKARVFVVRLSLWDNGTDAPGTRFETVVRPDRTPARAKPLTPTQRCQLSYWTKLGEDAGANERFSLQMSTKTPAAENYTDIAIGGSKKYCARLEIHTAKMEVRALFYSFKDDSLTETMAQRLDELERAVGAEGVPFKAKTASGIRFTKTGCNISGDRKRWSEFIAWQLNAAVEIKQVADAMLRHCGGR